MNGRVEIIFRGHPVTLRFNNYADEALGELLGMDAIFAMTDLVKRMQVKPFQALADLIWVGLLGAYYIIDKERDFEMVDIREWIGDAKQDEAAKIIHAWQAGLEERQVIPKTQDVEKKSGAEKSKLPGKKRKATP